MHSTGVLLVNLGSPDSTSVRDVRRYLREFLMDERVIDIPWLSRFCLVNFAILPFRPRKTAEAYRKIWRPEGSPLVVTSRIVAAALKQQLGIPVALAMRYQHPSLASGIAQLKNQGVTNVLLAPLYPHFAMSSYETVVVKAQQEMARLAPDMPLKILPPFFDHVAYIGALAASAEDYLRRDYDHLLFSFHGLPERHLRRADATGQHCLASPECCDTPHPAHRTCYRAQALVTVKAFVNAAGVPAEKYSIAFQSRLGRDPWLRPYTDHVLAQLPARGVKKLLVICPAFVTDCLETLEEIGLRGRELFRAAGGADCTLIPCMNQHPRWIKALAAMLRQLQAKAAGF